MLPSTSCKNFTADHVLAAKALRLPRGGFSTMDSPYLSLISLVKGWPQQNVRREVLMVTDGIDRLRGEQPSPSRWARFWSRVSQYADYEPDVNSASEISQRYNVIVYSIYAVGIGRAARNSSGTCKSAFQGLQARRPNRRRLLSRHFESGQLQTPPGSVAEDVRQSGLVVFQQCRKRSWAPAGQSHNRGNECR